MQSLRSLMLGAAVGMLLVGSGLLFAQKNLSTQDRKFIENAAKGGMMEVHMGELAQEKGKSDAVKAFGRRMMEDHGKANKELEALAQEKGVTLPSEKDASTLTSKSISTTSGAVFDKAYAKEMVSDHEKDVKEFEDEAKNGSDPDVKKWASTTLSTLRMHLQEARQLDK